MQDEVKRLTGTASEATRLQNLNNQLQQQVLDLSRMNASLAKENILTVTGGHSFCWMGFLFQFGSTVPLFIHSGRYTLYDVNVRITDLNKMRSKIEKHQGLALSDDVQINLGEVQVGQSWFDPAVSIPFSDQQAQDFNIFLSARNGIWTEKLRLRNVNGHWSSALQVYFSPRGRIKAYAKPVFEQVARDFPRNDKGLIDWEQ